MLGKILGFLLDFFSKDESGIHRNSSRGLESKLGILRFLLGTSLRRDGPGGGGWIRCRMQLTGICFFLFIDVHFGLLSFAGIVSLKIASWFRFLTNHHQVTQYLVGWFIHSDYLARADFMVIDFVKDPSTLNCKIRHTN